MNVEPRKIYTLDGATIILTQAEVRHLKAELDCVLRSAKLQEVPSSQLHYNKFESKYIDLYTLQRMLEEKCTL